MSVIVMGDQAVGKSTMMIELARHYLGSVRVLSPFFEDIEREHIRAGNILPTDDIKNTIMEMEVRLPQGYTRQFKVNWIDTPGEAWRVREPMKPNKWSSIILTSLREARFLIIMMAPYREIIREELLALDNLTIYDQRFRTQTQWVNRLEEWLSFLRDNRQYGQRILICLNMADLFLTLDELQKFLQQFDRLRWDDYRNYMLNTRFFMPIQQTMRDYDMKYLLPTQLFMTTKTNIFSLELPWLYIASCI